MRQIVGQKYENYDLHHFVVGGQIGFIRDNNDKMSSELWLERKSSELRNIDNNIYYCPKVNI